MDKLYCKWVDEDMMTMNDTKWEVGVPNELPEEDNLELCKEGLFHYAKHPLIAVIFKDFYSCGDYTKLYEVAPQGKIVEGWHTCGATKLTLVKELEIPEVSNTQKVAFAILCALEVCNEEFFVSWANKWLNNEDRSEGSASLVYGTVSLLYDDASANMRRIESLLYAGTSAKYVENYDIVSAAYYAVNAVVDPSDATYYIYNSAYYASHRNHNFNPDQPNIDLVSLAKKAMEVK